MGRKTLESICPEEVVSDFKIKEFIDKNIKELVSTFSGYPGKEKLSKSLGFLYGLINIASDTKSFEDSIKKYSQIVGLKSKPKIVSEIAPYVLQYIREKSIIPEEVVSDFKIKDYIEGNLLSIVDTLNKNHAWDSKTATPLYVNSIIQKGTNVQSYGKTLDKYEFLLEGVGVPSLTDFLAFPVRDFIKQEATKHNMHIIE